MGFLRLLPVFLSALLLAAHFLRAGLPALMIVALAFPALLAVPRRWAARCVQAALFLGAVEWIRTLLGIVTMYSQIHRPWGRSAIILGAVAALTAASAAVFLLPALRRRYRLDDEQPPGEKEG